MSSHVMICPKYEPNPNSQLYKLNINDFQLNVKSLSELVSTQLGLSEDIFG